MATASFSRSSRSLPSNFRRVLNLTHFIRIPLLNQTSSTQIQETLWRVANDPVAASVPPLAYRPFQRVNCGIAALSLPTREKRDHAISLLQYLGDQDWQKIFSNAQELRPHTRTSPSASPERLSDEDVGQVGPQPLVVSAILEAMPCQSMPCVRPEPCSWSKTFSMSSKLSL